MDGDFELYYDAVDPVTGEESRKRAGGPWAITVNPDEESETQKFTMPTDAKEEGKYILVFQGTLGAEAGAVVGKMVELVTTPFVFIIQESASAGMIATSEKSTHHSSEFYPSDSTFRILDTPHQELSGWFETYGVVDKIYVGGAPQLWINGVEIADGSWVPGDTEDPPETWKIEGSPEYTGGVKIWVEMKTGEVFTETLWTYIRLTRSGNGISGPGPGSQFLSTNMSLSTNRITVTKTTELALAGPGSLVGSKWKIIQINGHRPEDNFVTYEHEQSDFGLPIWSYLESKTITTGSTQVAFRHTWSEAVSLWHYSCGGWCVSNPTVENSGSKYNSIYQSESFIPNAFSGEIERRYTEAELDYLTSMGIDPVHYAIFLQ